MVSLGVHTPRATLAQMTALSMRTRAGAGAGVGAGEGGACTQVRLTANTAQPVHARTAPSRWVMTTLQHVSAF
eukprot:311319-Pelagomonas_calceolata.AAC.1